LGKVSYPIIVLYCESFKLLNTFSKLIILNAYNYFTEPNNESPLNVKAAQIWPRQEVFKATLLSTYKEPEST